MVGLFNIVDTYAGPIGVIAFIVVVAAIGIICGLVILKIIQYKHLIRVREVTAGKTRVSDDRAREVKDKEGVLKWQLLKRRHKLPVPPAEAVHLTKKGKFAVEAYYLPEGEYKYIIDNGVDTKKLTNFEPLDTADREFYASEMREAETYRKVDWKNFILPLAGGLMILAVFVLMLIFWEDIAAPGIRIVDKAAEVSEQQAKTAEIMRDIIQDRQEVPIKEGNG